MRNYVVTVKEVWYRCVLIKARGPDDALDLVEEGAGKPLEDSFEHSHTLESSEWLVHDAPEEVL